MSLRYYYFVTDTKTKEVLGMNLTEDEMKKMFYHDGGSSKGRSYGSTDFKIQSHEDYQLLMKLRIHFSDPSSDRYSYIVMTNDDMLAAKGFDELEEEMLETVKMCMHPEIKIKVYEIVGCGLVL